jgi:hypothetical protein
MGADQKIPGFWKKNVSESPKQSFPVNTPVGIGGAGNDSGQSPVFLERYPQGKLTGDMCRVTLPETVLIFSLGHPLPYPYVR